MWECETFVVGPQNCVELHTRSTLAEEAQREEKRKSTNEEGCGCNEASEVGSHLPSLVVLRFCEVIILIQEQDERLYRRSYTSTSLGNVMGQKLQNIL